MKRDMIYLVFGRSYHTGILESTMKVFYSLVEADKYVAECEETFAGFDYHFDIKRMGFDRPL